MADKKYIIDDEKLMKEWDYDENHSLKPNKLTSGSNKRAGWICSICNYKWSAKICNRSILGRGCPLCANKVVMPGINDLETTHYALVSEWHHEKNKNLKPSEFTYGSGKKVWWKCQLGHEFKATILHRSSGTNCPKCHSGRQTSFAEQATYYYVKKLYPDSLSRFTAEFLGRMELDIYIPSIKYAIEYDGEAWHGKNSSKRERRKYLACKNKGIKLVRLREKMSEIGSYSADYMYTAEKLYEPKNLEKVLTQLIRHLTFHTPIFGRSLVDINIERDRVEIQQYRTAYKSGSLAERFPDTAAEWHPEKNGELTPDMYLPSSDQKAWWLCPMCDNEYEASIGHRTRGTSCPLCGIEKSTKAKRKPVMQIDPESKDVIETFISISDASRKLGINGSNITMVCKGIRPKAGGFVWKYANES